MHKKIIFFLLLSLKLYSQSFINYVDTNFRVSFPENWIVVSKEKIPELALVAYRKPESEIDYSQVTINVNIINTPQFDLNKSYSGLLNSISEAKNFKLLKQGESRISNQPFKWLIESHSNHKMETQEMYNYVFLTYKNNKTYILTMVSFSEVFEDYKSVFDSISKSLIIN